MFNEKDVITVAKALLEDPIEIGDAAFKSSYFWCLHCDAKWYEADIKTRRNFKHDAECPCMVAQDLLTRLE